MFVFSLGVAALLLSKRLDSYAIQIAASNVQHGGKAAGLTVPSVQAQASVLERIYSKLTAPSYIECHGTGTQLGDPIEFSGLVKCFKEREAKKGERPAIVLGAVKTLIGHLESCSGMAGVIKLVLSMRFQCVGPLMHFSTVNKSIPILGSRFAVANEAITWETKNSVGGVSSFGMGGVNAHVALRLLSSVREERCGGCQSAYHRVVLSAEPGVLERMTVSFADYLSETPDIDLCGVASALSVRFMMPESIAVVAASIKDLRYKLLSLDSSVVSLDSSCSHAHRLTGLPKYSFRENRLWFRLRSDDQQQLHTLAATKLTWRLLENVFFLRDHVVQGSVILPGVFYLELARRTWKSLALSSPFALQQVVWQAPSVPSNGILDMDVQIEGGKVEMFVRDRQVFSCFVPVEAASVASTWSWPRHVALDWTMSKEEAYVKLREHGLAYGSSLNAIDKFGLTGKYGFSFLRKNGDLGADLVLHPSLLDGAFQTVVMHHICSHENGSVQFLPFNLERIVWSLPSDFMPDEVVALVEDQSLDVSHQLQYQIWLVDPQTLKLLVEFVGFVRKPNSMVKQGGQLQALTTTTVRVSNNRPSIYVDTWKSSKFVAPTGVVGGKLLVLNDAGTSEGGWANFTTRFESCSFVAVHEKTKSSFDALFTEWKDRMDMIVIDWSDLSVLSVFHMVKSLLGMHLNINMVRLFRGLKGDAKGLASMVGGLARTLVYESPLMPLVSVWLEDPLLSVSDVVASLLVEETTIELLELRFCNGNRLERSLEEAKQLELDASRPVFGKSKRYLITGGAGGIGLVLARHLGRTYQAHIVLLGRRPYVPNEMLDSLKVDCASVEYVSADVCNLSELQRAVPYIGDIHGVIHCAGLIRDAFLLNKSEMDFLAVLGPKMDGCRNLDALTKSSPLDFFVVCSSIAALLPNQGQSDYASANSFMDAFVLERSGPGKSVSIGWSLWEDGGMKVTTEEKEHLEKVFGIHPLSSSLALVGFEELLRSSVRHAIIASPNARIGSVSSKASVQSGVVESKDLKRIISTVLAEELMLNPGELLDNTSFSSLGLSSMVISSINSRLEEQLGPISKTLFFEYDNLKDVLAHFARLATRRKKGTAVKRVAKREAFKSFSSLLSRVDADSKCAFCVLKPLDLHVHGFFIGGRASVPGGCFLEFAMQAGSFFLETAVTSVKDNFWPNPMFMDAAAETVMRIDFTESSSGGALNFVVSSEEGVHATGALGFEDDDCADMDSELRDWAGTLPPSPPTKTVDREQFYSIIEANAELHLEGRFRLIREMKEFDKVAVSRYELTDDMSLQYHLHPVVVTGVEQTLLVFTALKYKPLIAEELKLMPVAIEFAGAVKQVPPSGWIVLSSLTNVMASNLLHKVDAFVLDDDLNCVACVKGNAMRIQRSTSTVVPTPIRVPSLRSVVISSRAVRVGDAWNMRQFCEGLQSSREMMVAIPVDRWVPNADLPKDACLFVGLSQFDCGLFSISPKEAVVMDPQHRMVLECCWEALFPFLDEEDKNVGVYVGIGKPEYALRGAVVGYQSGHFETGNWNAGASGRVSFTFDLQGRAMCFDTACSSSLVSVLVGMESVRLGIEHRVLAGGVNAICHIGTTLNYFMAGTTN